MLSATIVRSGEDAAVQRVLAATAEATTAEWQRGAMLRGLEVALLGAPAPGNAAGRRNAAPRRRRQRPRSRVPPVPAAAAGLAASYAFPRPADWPTAASRPGADLRLNW